MSKKNITNESGPTLVGYIATSDEINALKQELLKGRIGVFLDKGNLISVLTEKKIKRKKELKIVKIEVEENKIFNNTDGKFCIRGNSEITEIQSYKKALRESLAEVA